MLTKESITIHVIANEQTPDKIGALSFVLALN